MKKDGGAQVTRDGPHPNPSPEAREGLFYLIRGGHTGPPLRKRDTTYGGGHAGPPLRKK